MALDSATEAFRSREARKIADPSTRTADRVNWLTSWKNSIDNSLLKKQLH